MFSQRSEEDDYEKPKENFLDDSGGSDVVAPFARAE